MKKFLRLTAALMAVFAMTSFIACSSDDDDDDDEVAVTAVEITAESTEVEVGKTITLTAKVSPDDATDKTVTWTSSDPAKATVDGGVVTGVAEGTVTITAKAGDKTKTKDITVKAASTGDETGGTTGGETGGETGGTTGGETGGTTGGETGGSTGGTVTEDKYTIVHNGEPVDKETYTLAEAKELATEYGLVETTDYTIDTENKKIILTDTGKEKVDEAMGGAGDEPPVVPIVPAVVTPAIYNLSALTADDYVTLGSVVDGVSQQYSDSKGTLKDSLKVGVLNPAVELSNGLMVFNTSANQLLVRTASKDDLTPAGAINYGGQSVGNSSENGTVPENVGDPVALSETVKVSRYLAIPVTGGDATSQFKVSVTYKPTNTAGIQIVLVDQNNVMLAKDDANSVKEEKTFVSPAITKGDVTEVRVYLFRTGAANSGGADVSEIAIAPVTE